jgi:hypothetical protein
MRLILRLILLVLSGGCSIPAQMFLRPLTVQNDQKGAAWCASSSFSTS